MEHARPPPELQIEESPVARAAAWQKWWKQFSVFLKASGVNKEEKGIQASLLVNLIGPEGYEVFSNFTFVKEDDAEDIECLKKKFDEHFGTKSNITAVRFKFFTRNQHPGETISQYVTALKTLSKNCEFEHLKDGLIRDRIVCGVSNTVVRDRMLRTTTLTLEKAVEICEAEELARQESKKIEEVTTSVQVDAVAGPSGYGRGRGTFRGRGRGWFARSRAGGSGGSGSGSRQVVLPRQRGQREPCGRCGSFYCDNGQRCPAVSAICFVCDRRGHFAKKCPHKSASKQVYNLNVTSDQSEDDDYDEEDSSLFISALKRDFTSPSTKEWIVNMDINGKSISFKLDSGAPLNVMSKITYESLGYKVSMLTTFKTNVFSYTGNKLPIIGECYLPILHKRAIYQLKFAITEMCVQNLIGLEDCVKLGFIQRIGALDINNYADLFRGIGKLPGIHKIIVNNSVEPVVCPARKVPLGLRDKLWAELQRMEMLGVVRKVNHPTDWVNPIVIVSKKNGDIRVCLDPRILNRAVRRAHFSFPTVSEIASRLRGARFYSVLDARCGFWMLELDAASADLCTFSTPFGRYQFLRLPYGINCAPEMFHAKVRQHIEDLEGTDSFSDDIIVWGSSRKEHDERLERLLQRAKEIGLRFNKEKCKFGVSEITYLGHVFNKEGMKPDSNKVKAILEMPNPEDRKSLERFLGMVNYLSKFIPNYSESVAVLRSLLKKNNDWVWDEQHSIAIKQLKNKLSVAPVLALYSNTVPIVISVDASSSALGAVLLQDGRPVEFASLTLTDTQCRYAQIEKEMLAIVFSCERFHQYIFGRNDVTIQSDHKPLESIFKKSLISVPARLQRMMLRIQSYDIHVVYTPGKYMYIADTLSRAALPQLMNERITKDVDAQMCAVIAQVQFSDAKLSLVRQHTEKDNECLMLKNYIVKGWPRSRYEVSESIRKYWSYRECLQFVDGIILKNNCVFIPKTLRGEMLIRVHEGHLGIDRCKRRARDIMFWPGMSRDIEERVRGCDACAQLAPRQQREPLRPHDIPDVPWSKLGSDIFELHKKYYLVLVDYFSNFVEVNELKSINSKSVIKAMKEQFSRHGIPHELITDNGPAYRSLEFDNFMREWDIVHITSSPLYAQSNGKSERTVRTIKELFKKCLKSGQDPYLSLLNFRATPRNGLDSPAQILMGRRLNTRLPVHKQMLKETVNNVKNYDRIISQQKLTKDVYDRSAKPFPPLKTGAKVVVADGQKREFMEVVDKCDEPRSYVLRDIIGRRYRRNRRHIIDRQTETKGKSAVATSSGSAGAASDVTISCAPSTSATVSTSTPQVQPHVTESRPTATTIKQTEKLNKRTKMAKNPSTTEAPVTRSRSARRT